MKNKYYLILFFLLFQRLEADVLESVINKFQTSTFKANFVVELNNSQQKGVLYYQKGQIHIRLSDGNVLASNYKQIIVYDSDTKVAGKQDKIPGGGLSWILNYPRKIEGNKAIIEPTNKIYEKIIIHWNSDLFPISIVFIKNSDSKIVYKFSNIVYLNNISLQYFSYKPPAGSRSVDNPLNLKK